MRDVHREPECFFDTIAEFVLPHVNILVIMDRVVESCKLKYMLDHFLGTLETLGLNVTISRDDDYEVERIESLAESQAIAVGDGLAFWSPLWARCQQVQRLEVWEIGTIVQSLAEGSHPHAQSQPDRH